MMRWMRLPVKICALLIVIVMLAGCMNAANDSPPNDESNSMQPNMNARGMRAHNAGSDQLLQTDTEDAVIPMIEHNGLLYVPLQQLAQTLSFQSEWAKEGTAFHVGDNDVAYEIPVNAREATRAGEPVQLSQPSIVLDGLLYIPYEALEPLFGDAMTFSKRDHELLIAPSAENLEGDSGLPDFADDPNDPHAGTQKISMNSDMPVMLTAADVDADKLIATAKKYIGVGYDFGAAPYPKSGKFDCSTFTQYVYGKYGVDLPRLSRQQGKVGTPVSRTSLRKGDLLFFYLPGRYKSNNIIGHVGIYMGNGQMIHSSTKPKDGVQITSINKEFWKKTYLSARRVI